MFLKLCQRKKERKLDIYRVLINYCVFLSNNFLYFATSPSPALGWYCLYRKCRCRCEFGKNTIFNEHPVLQFNALKCILKVKKFHSTLVDILNVEAKQHLNYFLFLVNSQLFWATFLFTCLKKIKLIESQEDFVMRHHSTGVTVTRNENLWGVKEEVGNGNDIASEN